jgi:putative FmdB family regulatory protein
MPIYEYRCEACGHNGEHLQKVSEAPLVVCPECGKRQYRKQLSAAGFQLKGTGWYATDFKGGGKKAAEKKTEAKPEEKKSSEAKPASSSDGKSDSKPQSKPESKAAA